VALDGQGQAREHSSAVHQHRAGAATPWSQPFFVPVRPSRSRSASSRLTCGSSISSTERGIAGARVDRIASAAQANKRLIYDYFTDKDGLFDAALDAVYERIVDAVAIDTDDLPGYAGRLFTYAVEHPQLLRLTTWARLEGRLVPTARERSAQSYHRRLAAIDAAQRSGKIATTFTPAQLLTLIESISVGWITTTAPSVDPEEDPSQHCESHRDVVVESVRRLLT
jgi:AcrR family transcriptional regulator